MYTRINYLCGHYVIISHDESEPLVMEEQRGSEQRPCPACRGNLKKIFVVAKFHPSIKATPEKQAALREENEKQLIKWMKKNERMA